MSDSNNSSQVRKAELDKFSDYEHEKIDADFARLIGTHVPLTKDNADQLTHTTAQSIQGRINNEIGKVNEAADKMVAAMSEFLKEFTEFSQTLSTGRAYASSFLAVQARIEGEISRNTGSVSNTT